MGSSTAKLASRTSGASATAGALLGRSLRGPGWMSIEDLSAELGVPLSTAYKWSAAGPRSGKFPQCRKLPNGSIRIRRDWFEAWIEGLGADA